MNTLRVFNHLIRPWRNPTAQDPQHQTSIFKQLGSYFLQCLVCLEAWRKIPLRSSTRWDAQLLFDRALELEGLWVSGKLCVAKYMCVCVYNYTYIYEYIYIYIYMYMSAYVYMCTRVYNFYIQRFVIYVHTFVSLSLYIYIHTHTDA